MFRFLSNKWHLVKQTYPYGAQYIFIIYAFAFIPVNELLLLWIFNWSQGRILQRFKVSTKHLSHMKQGLSHFCSHEFLNRPKFVKTNTLFEGFASLLGQKTQAHSRPWGPWVTDFWFCDKGMEWRVIYLYLTDQSPWIIIASNCYFELNHQTTFESNSEFWVCSNPVAFKFCSLLQNN